VSQKLRPLKLSILPGVKITDTIGIDYGMFFKCSQIKQCATGILAVFFPEFF